MTTNNQLILCKKRHQKKTKNRNLILDCCPQKKGTCMKIFITSPKKPNSSARKVAKVLFLSNKRSIHCYIPGISHSLQKFSTVLVRGGRVRDLPGIRFKIIRGKFDLKQVYDRRKGCSKYGVPKID